MFKKALTCFALLAVIAKCGANDEWFNGQREAQAVSAAVCKEFALDSYPELFQIELWQNGDYRNKAVITGKWADLDKNGEAVYPQAKVKVSIESVSSGETAWRIAVTPTGKNGVFYVKYPILAVPKSADPAERLLVPQQYGRALEHPSQLKDYYDGELPRLKKAIWFGPYGGQKQSMQMLIYELSKGSFMLWTQDPEGYAKDFVVSESEAKGSLAGKAMLFYVYHFPAKTGQVGTAWNSPYPTVTSKFNGSYYLAAKRYRQWAVKQPWCAKGTITERIKSGDLPKWFASNTLWATCCVPQNLPMLQEFAGAFPFTDIGVFLTMWQRWGFDENVPQYFPPKDEAGYKKLIAAQKDRLHFMPYMNMHLIDGDYKWAVDKFSSGRALAMPENAMVTDTAECRDYAERWGTFKNSDGTTRKRFMYPMCRSTKLWQDYFNGMANQNLQHYGADGQYFDQVAVLPYPCWDKKHGHPVGFGPYLLQGGRQMLENARRDNPGKLIFGEHLQEFYIGALDECYAIWPAYYQDKTVLVPLFPLVYQDYVSQHEWSIIPQTLKNPADFAHALALSIHLGHKPGSFVMIETIIGLLQSENSRALSFLKQIEAALRVSKSIYGEKLADPEITGSPIQEVALWENAKKSRKVSVPAVTASAWKLPESGQTALLLTNAGTQPAAVGVISEYLPKQTELQDARTKEKIAWNAETKISLPPLSARMLVIGATNNAGDKK
ncbi:MAG: DUF6259 domain-containing protein [Victivallaceae bacterium]